MRRHSTLSKTQPVDHLLKNLRLLDLDEEFDSPSITRSTFSATSAPSETSTRIHAALWVLYRLFERYDPDWTQAHLSELFPPLEPRQATELRVRLFRRLSELKQHSPSPCFGRDVTIRRTMFDDCKGPRFEEVLALFSGAVLQRQLTDRSIASQMLTGTQSLNAAHKLPLTLAYQSSFQSILRLRASRSARFRALGNALQSQRHELDARAAKRIVRKDRVPQRMLDRLESTLRSSWTGNEEWADIVLRGDRHRHCRRLLERPFAEVWDLATSDRLHELRPVRNDSLLRQLETRVGLLNDRVRHWRRERDRLFAQSEVMAALEHEHEHEHDESGHYPESDEQDLDTPASMNGFDPVKSKQTSCISNTTPKPSSRDKATTSPDRRESVFAPDSSFSQQTPIPRRYNNNNEGYGDTSPSPSFHHDPRATQASHIVSSVLHAAPTPARPLPSLAERTRMSMARASPHRPVPSLQSPQPLSHTTEHSPGASALSTASAPSTAPAPSTASGMSGESATPTTLSTLAERTRHSMSLMASKPPPRSLRRTSRMRASVLAYPVNQFEPESSVAEEPEELTRLDGLEERLEELRGDEEAAFRSRPRVAASPPPEGKGVGLMGQRERGSIMEIWSGEGDDEGW